MTVDREPHEGEASLAACQMPLVDQCRVAFQQNAAGQVDAGTRQRFSNVLFRSPQPRPSIVDKSKRDRPNDTGRLLRNVEDIRHGSSD